MAGTYYADGDWNALCWECGRKRKGSELKRNWKGYYVCPEHWEPRHPQDFVRGVPDNQSPPYTQPDTTIIVPVCTILGIMGVAGYGVAGCALAGFKNQTMIDSFLSSPSVFSIYAKLAYAGYAVAGVAIAGDTDG